MKVITTQLALLALAAPALAQFPVEWDANRGVLPMNTVPAFLEQDFPTCGPSTAEFLQGALRLDTSACEDDILFYESPWTGPPITPPAIYWVEADIQVQSILDPTNGIGVASVRLIPGYGCPYSFELTASEVVLRYHSNFELGRAPVDTTSGVRTWRIEVERAASRVEVFADGQSVLSSPMNQPGLCFTVPPFLGSVAFGDPLWTQGGVVDWHGVRHNLASASQEFCGSQVANSTGAATSLTWSGSRRAISPDFTIQAQGAPPSVTAIFLCSRAVSAPTPIGMSQGLLCLGGAVGRLTAPGQILMTDSAGFASLVVDPTRLPQANGFVSAASGERWNFQLWHRDQNPAATSNLSTGLQVLFQ